MKFYNDFNSMFNAQSGVKMGANVFNNEYHHDYTPLNAIADKYGLPYSTGNSAYGFSMVIHPNQLIVSVLDKLEAISFVPSEVKKDILDSYGFRCLDEEAFLSHPHKLINKDNCTIYFSWSDYNAPLGNEYVDISDTLKDDYGEDGCLHFDGMGGDCLFPLEEDAWAEEYFSCYDGESVNEAAISCLNYMNESDVEDLICALDEDTIAPYMERVKSWGKACDLILRGIESLDQRWDKSVDLSLFVSSGSNDDIPHNVGFDGRSWGNYSSDQPKYDTSVID